MELPFPKMGCLEEEQVLSGRKSGVVLCICCLSVRAQMEHLGLELGEAVVEDMY